ncbi:hypothetical protein BKG82_26900 [Mycobacteroides chelonae]|uniref:Uncharacterized protein n=1 Tax=Mycobacteroides chelonae TaxID=1774 RepID=A0A1S1LIY4_MYCCH|nr:hypothetical protein [Mycobacteroides chelonae]OHU47282.1 hypothetical protein BKG82_26900 [Mycobacteroides chelonae]
MVSLREQVAAAVRIMLEANGFEGMADEYEMADSLIASLGLEPSWYIPTTKCDDGAYRGGHSFATEAQVKRYLREVTPGAEVWKSWAMAPVRVSLDAQAEIGE